MTTCKTVCADHTGTVLQPTQAALLSSLKALCHKNTGREAIWAEFAPPWSLSKELRPAVSRAGGTGGGSETIEPALGYILGPRACPMT